MPDEQNRDKIDLDALIDTLIREKEKAARPAGSGASVPPTAPAAELRHASAEPPAVHTGATHAAVQGVAVPETAGKAEAAKKTDTAGETASAAAPASEEGAETAGHEAEESRAAAGRHPRRRLFSRREENNAEPPAEEWADWGLKPIGHYRAASRTVVSEEQTEVIVPPTVPKTPAAQAPVIAPVEEFPPVRSAAHTGDVAVEDIRLPEKEAATRVIPIAAAAPAQAERTPADVPAEEPEESLHDPDQLSLEELVRIEDAADSETAEPQDDDMADAEERMRAARQEKIKDFMIGGEEEEPNEPEEEAELPEEEPVIEDFSGYEESGAVRLELQYRSRTALWSMLLTGVLELISLVLTFVTVYYGQSPITDVGFLTVQAFVLGLMLVLNASSVGRGLTGLFTLRANNDTAPALTGIFSLAGVVLHFANLGVGLPLWPSLAGLPVLFGSVAGYVRAQRVRENFTFVSYPGEKYVASLIDEPKALREIGRRVVIDDDADVVYFHRSAFLSDYLKHAYEDDRGDDWCRWLSPVLGLLALALSLLLAAVGAVKGFWAWLELYAFLLCLTTASTALGVQLPLRQCCRHMLGKGGFLVGWKAVRDFGSPDALTIDVADLYPDESMLLHGIKTFGGMHIDDAILDAASLAIRSGGPLSRIFCRIIQNKQELLHEVDSLVYEQGMGLSGWVDGRRVLVGNRRLLENHGVDVPSSDYEARYAKDGRRLVYLSTAGELSAMFVVTYLPDEAIRMALQELCRAHVTLLVRSCDPNITAADLCRDFDLDEYYVDILPASAGRIYDQLVSTACDSAPAVMASNGHILGTAMALAACRSLQVKCRIALLVQVIGAGLGLLLGTVWASAGLSGFFLPLFGCCAAVPLLSLLLPLIRRT